MARKKYKITALVDYAAVPDNDSNFTMSNSETTEHHVIQTIRELGHDVNIIAIEDDIIDTAKQLKSRKPHLVFNMTEEFKGDRSKDKNIAAMLDLLGIPFTGTGTSGLLLCRDKSLCKQILAHHKIKVPKFYTFRPKTKIKPNANIKFPLVVKPAYEDGSEGISNASIVHNIESLEQRISFVTGKWNQKAIAEEYIDGREFYVGIIGNKQLTALPLRECKFGSDPNSPKMATYNVKWDKNYRNKWGIDYCFAELEAEIEKKIQRVCKKVHKILQLRDYSRIDLRLTAENKIVILEANPNPDIAYGEEVAEAAEKAGIGYEQLIQKIITLAINRK